MTFTLFCGLVALQLCVRLCEAYKQQYISLRDAVKLDNPSKVRGCLLLLSSGLLACKCQVSESAVSKAMLTQLLVQVHANL